MDFISSFSSSLPLLIGLTRYKYLTNSLKILLLFFLMYFVGDAYTIWLGILMQNNLFVLNIYPILGTLLLSASYLLVIQNTAGKQIIAGSAILLSCTCLLAFKYDSVSTVELFIYKLYVVLVVLIHFNDILSDLRVKNILSHSMFWISASLIIYAMGTLFVSLFSTVIFNPAIVDDATFDTYWNLNNILFIIMIVLASVGLWFAKCDRANLI